MDRLSTVIVGSALAACWGCDGNETPGKQAETRSRINIVAASKPNIDIAGFCDVHSATGQGKKLVLPELRSAAPEAGAGWRWINVWATWCKPCVEELPMLTSLKSKFATDHLPLSLVFLS